MNLIHNEVTALILSMDLKSDAARVARTIANGGQVLVDTLGAFLTCDAINAMNQKSVMKAVQAVSFAVSGATEDLDKVTASAVATVMLTADQTISFESLRYVSGASNIINPRAINGVSRARFQRFGLRGYSASTIATKVSNRVGKRGILTALGVTFKSDAHSFTLNPGARESGFVLAFASQLERMTDGAFALVYKDE